MRRNDSKVNLWGVLVVLRHLCTDKIRICHSVLRWYTDGCDLPEAPVTVRGLATRRFPQTRLQTAERYWWACFDLWPESKPCYLLSPKGCLRVLLRILVSGK